MLINRLLICCLLLIISVKVYAQEQTPEQLLETVQSSLVAIRGVATKTVTADNGQTRVGTYQALGSGIIIDSAGIIVTNTHIIANAQDIYVGLSDGTILKAKVVYSSDADFSFIKVDAPYSLNTITWADSSQAVVGTPIMALKNDDDEHQQIQGGEITNLMYGADSNNVELFELNLNLFPGDSGGPLLDNQGHLLGMIMAKKKDEDNKTYAIASHKIQQEFSNYSESLPN